MGSFGSAIGISFNIGYPGQISRSAGDETFSRQVQSTDAEGISFGDVVVLNSNNTYTDLAVFIAAGGTFTAAKFCGIACREVKQELVYLEQSTGFGVYQPGEFADVLLKGTVPVVVNVGTPTAGGTVYVRIAANGGIPDGVVGGIEAAADGSNTVALTNAKFTTGDQDENNVAEVTILYRQF
jgi:hypothetical protein